MSELDLPPLPRSGAEKPLLDPRDWLRAQGAAATQLARAAMALGRLDEVVAAMGPGAVARIAAHEVEAMLWACGTPLRREEIGRDLMDARAGSDLNAMRLARWALRRLEGQGELTDLRGFLGLYRTAQTGLPEIAPRPVGLAFDDAAEGFAEGMAQIAAAHPITRAGFARRLWRLSELSAEGVVIEPATWAARTMAEGCAALTFAPMGSFGRPLWQGFADGPDDLATLIGAVEQGATAARAALYRLRDWAGAARDATARIKGDNPARIIDALLAQPLASTAMVETAAGISRDTAERLLARMAGMGLVREVTGTRRFRLWTAAVS